MLQFESMAFYLLKSTFSCCVFVSKSPKEIYHEQFDHWSTTSLVMGFAHTLCILKGSGTHNCSKNISFEDVQVGKGPPIFKPKISRMTSFVGNWLLLRNSESCGNSVNLLQLKFLQQQNIIYIFNFTFLLNNFLHVLRFIT